MNHRYRITFYFAAVLSLIVGFSSLFAQEDPRLWDTDGISVRQGDYLEWQRQAARHEDGSTCVVWSDTRKGNRDIYAQRIRSDGTAAWPENGVTVVSQGDRQEDPVIIAVADGWIIAWAEYIDLENDYYPDYNCSIYAQKLDLMGNTRWRIDGALVVNTGTDFIAQRSLQLVPDMEGGAIVLWLQDYYTLHAQRINSEGVVAWEVPVFVAEHVDRSYYYVCEGVVSDGMGNVFLTWLDNRDVNDRDIYAAKLLADGSLPWGSGVNGVPICTADASQSRPRLCCDQAGGGVYCAWEDERNSYLDDLYIQRIDSSGNPLWQTDGLLLCGAENQQERTRIAPSFAEGIQDGVLCAWEDNRINGYINEVYAQKVNSEGSFLWGENGLLVCGDATPDFQGYTRDEPLILSDGSGGAIIYWNDTRNVQGDIMRYDIFASRLNADGENLWGECGVPAASGEGLQAGGFMIPDFEAALLEVFYGQEAGGSRHLNHTRLSLTDGSPILEEADLLTHGFSGNVKDIKTIAMSDDRVGIVWEDRRGWYYGEALYYQIVDGNGSFELPTHGIKLAPDNTGYEYYDQRSPALASDGNGGFFVAFMDNRAGINQIRLSKINSEGEIVSDPAGVLLYDYFFDQYAPLICPDGSGGCYVAWQANDISFTLDVYVHHLDENCEALWTEPVRLTNDGIEDDVLYALVQSEGGCIAVWETGHPEQLDILAARVSADGEVDWTQTISDAERRQSRPSAAEDGFGGVFVVWQDSRTEQSSWDIYAQYLNIDGELLWEANGIPVATEQNDQFSPITLYSPLHGLYVVWEDFRSGQDIDLYAQKTDLSGNLLWEADGLAISTADDDQTEPALAPNNLGGFTCVWSDRRDNYSDIYASDILPDGSTSSEWWEAGSGGIVSTAYHNQTDPSITSIGGYRLFVAWEDWRATGFPDYDRFYDESGPTIDVYVQMIETGTTSGTKDALVPMPNEYALHQNYPNPFNPSTTISFSIPTAGQTSLIVYDLLGRTVETLVNKQLTAGSYHVSWNAGALPSGVYFYRLTAGEFSDVKKTVLLK